jgi:RecA-family ATPase
MRYRFDEPLRVAAPTAARNLKGIDVAEHSGGIRDLQAIARALGGEAVGNRIRAPGPGHSTKDRSLVVTLDPNAPDGFVTHSFAGDDDLTCKDYVRQKAGLRAFMPNGPRPRESDVTAAVMAAVRGQGANGTKRRLVETYEYKDGAGALLYQVLRFEPKDFRQRRPNGNGGWIWSAGEQRVPYRLPELLQYPDATVFITEGEKDANRVASIGHCATTVACGKWTSDCVNVLAGRDVLILEDNDEAGRKRALEAATALHGTAKTIRIVRLPALPDKGDVSDWLEADRRNTDRFVDVCFAAPLWEPTTSESKPDGEPPKKIQWLKMSNWDREPIPERKWAIPDRVPLNQAGLLSGEGGVGKSIIELTKNVAHVSGKDWFGSLPELGPAIYIGAEDNEDEIHIRLAAIANHYGVTFDELIAGGLHVLCLLGQDATLCTASGKSGKVDTTDLYRQIYEAAGDIKPKNISIDTVSRAFAGNEIDRVQVYAFAMHMQALAMVANGSVTVLSHPSIQGIASGTGLSGSTAWHGAFRFRQYLKGVKPDNGEQPDNDLRELEFKKNQYGPIAEAIVLRYQHGLFLPLPGTSLAQAAREAKADDVFLALLGRFTEQNRYVGDKTGPNYAPALFAKEEAAKTAGLTSHSLAAAMRRLFATGKIWNEPCGKPSRPRYRIALRP